MPRTVNGTGHARADAAGDGKRVVVDLRDRRPDARVRAVAAPVDKAPAALEIVDGYSRRRDHDAGHDDRLGGHGHWREISVHGR